MVSERQFQNRGNGRAFVFICAVTVVLCGSYLFAAEQSRTNKVGVGAEPARYRVFPLRHISAEQGKKYLSEVNIGKVSQLPSPNTLLVTAQQSELIKASAILKLVDTREQFVIKAIFPASEAKNLPSNDKIEALVSAEARRAGAGEVGNISIGTFSNPPTYAANAAKTKAIIDIHNDVVIAVAPASRLERIISAIEQLQISYLERDVNETELKKTADSPEAAGQDNEADVESDELFGLLAEAEKKAIKSAISAAEPTDVVEGAEAKDTAEKPKAEPDLKPTLEQSAIKTEQPEPAPAEAGVAEPAAAIRPYEPEPIPSGDEMLELDLPGKLEIGDLLGLVGEYLHLDYMYDSAKVKGDVTLKLQGPIKVKDLYPLLESVLKFKNFVMTRKGNLVTIVPAAEALEIDPALQPERGKIKLGDVIITRVFNLKHIDTTSAKNLLSGMKLGADISPIAETGTLIVTGYAYRMARIEELLEIIDMPGKPKQFRFRQLKYTMAKTLAPKIKTLAEQLGTISITVSKPPSPAPKRGRRPPKPTPTPKAARPAVYLDADERTNRILMIGLEEQLTVVDGLIDALDVQQRDLRTMRLYDIQNVGAEEVKKKLEELGIIGGARATAPPRPARPSKSK